MSLEAKAIASEQDTDLRISRPARSRHGCNTCKVRRVKCDESKPGCKRCLKFGRPCDGYTIKKVSQPSERAKSAPRVRSLAPVPFLARSTQYSPRSLVDIPFSDQNEARYFRIFHEDTPGALSGDFDSPLWNRIVLQACHNEPCIMHGAVAISALDQWCKVKSIRGTGPESEIHHQYALQQYSKALKGLQHVVFNRQDSLRTALIASLLIFCFENFHGDIRLALTNVRSAVDLMHAWLARNTSSISKKGSSPHPHIVEDELVAAFARLDVHLLSWIDEPQVQNTSILSYAITEPTAIPSSFTSLVEAKDRFDHVINRTFKYLTSVRALKNEVDTSLRGHNYNANGRHLVEPAVAAELRDWMSAFDPLFRSVTEKDMVTAKTLRIYALTLQVSLRSAFFPASSNNKQFDVFLPEHREIVALARSVSNHPSFVRSFVFDSFIVACLFIVAAKSSDIMLRREVIDVLRKASPRREGVWDALMVAEIGEELLKFESQDGGTFGNEWAEIHLQCICMTFMLPAPVGHDGAGSERGAERLGSRKPLLDWVERTMRMDVVSEEPRYRSRQVLN